MKVSLKNLSPNPYRDFERNPFDPDRVKEHERSIKEHGMWQKLMARKKNREIQIVFGHHRLQALKNLFGEDHEIEVEIVDYDDDQMLKALAAENDPVWNHSIREIDEMVSGAKKFFEDMKKADPQKFKEYARALFSSMEEDKIPKRISIGALLVSVYLKWPKKRVEEAFTRLNAIEEGVIDRNVLYSFLTARSAMTYLHIIKSIHPYDLERVDAKDQHQLVQEIIKEGRLGKRSMEMKVYGFRKWLFTQYPKPPNAADVDYCDHSLRQAKKSIYNTIHELEEFKMGIVQDGFIFKNIVTIDDIYPDTIEAYYVAVDKFTVVNAKLAGWLQGLQPNKDLEEDLVNDEEPSPEELAKIAREKDDRKEEERKGEDSGKPVEEMSIAEKIKLKVAKLNKATP